MLHISRHLVIALEVYLASSFVRRVGCLFWQVIHVKWSRLSPSTLALMYLREQKWTKLANKLYRGTNERVVKLIIYEKLPHSCVSSAQDTETAIIVCVPERYREGERERERDSLVECLK